jgi:outer membrane beta-barrel protein
VITWTKRVMKRGFGRAVLASVAAAAVLATAGAAQAQEVQLTGPLKGAPAVRNMRLYREGRFEIAPAVSFTLLDEYRRTIVAGARINYNIKDWIAIGVWGGAGVASLTTDLSDKIDQTAPRNALTAVNVNHTGDLHATPPTQERPASFNEQTAQIQYIVAPQVTFIPFRGKLAIFNKIFVDTDFYAAAGIGIVGVNERTNCGGNGQPYCTSPASFQLQSQTKFAPTFGVGFTFYLGGTVSLGVEYRALPFAWNRSGFDSRGGGPGNNFPDGQVNGDDETFQFNQLVTISLGFSFPTKPQISE